MNKNNKLYKLLLLSSLAYSSYVSAAEVVNLTQVEGYSPLAKQQLLTQQGDDQFQQSLALQDVSGNTRVKLQQYYQGVPIFGESVVASINEQHGYSNISGNYIKAIAQDISNISPSLSPEKASEIAQNNDLEFTSSSVIENLESQLFIWLDQSNKAHLVWLISYVHHGDKPTRPHVIIEANSGKVLDQWDGLTHAKATGPGGNLRTGRYEFGAGKRYPAFDVTESGGTCRLDSTNVVTYDMNHQKSGGSVHQFPCYENTGQAVNGSYSALNDAHAFGQISFSMYKDWFNAAPITQKLKLRIHYDRNYEGAFWDGQQMTFGDGANEYHNMVALDVVAHEVSHGFTQQNSNLVYRNQSGGLNESFSDIAAAAAIYYAEGDYNWQIGDRIKKHSGARRYMNNPPQDGVSIDHTSQYRSGMDVHYSSGIYNKAFYLLATTEDWDIKKAFEVMVRANRLYWNANSDFTSAGQGVYLAAKDLGYCVDDVLTALDAVGVSNDANRDDENCSGNTSPPIRAGFEYQVSNLSVSFTDKSTDLNEIVSFEWNFGDGNSSTQQHPTHTYANAGTYNVSLKATSKYEDSSTVVHQVTVTAAPEIIVDFEAQINDLEVTFTNTTTHGGNVDGYLWNFGDGVSSSEVNPKHTFKREGKYLITLIAMYGASYTEMGRRFIKVPEDFQPCDLPVWNVSERYDEGDKVSHNGFKYRATWWSQGADPEVYTNVWVKEDACPDVPNDKIQSKFSYVDTGWLVNFTSESTSELEIADYEWDFGDGSDGSFFAEKAMRLYKNDGTYTVTLKVTDVEGNSSTSSQQITVKLGNPAPVPDFTYEIDGLTITLQSTSTDNSAIASLEWSLGDGNTAIGESVQHTYGAAGQYTVTLKVTDDQDTTAEKSLALILGEPDDQPPVAQFSYALDQLTVNFTEQSTDDVAIDSWSWSFGDGTSSLVKNPSHTYAESGSYQVQLVVTDTAGLTNSIGKTVTVVSGTGCTVDAWSSSVIYWKGDRVSRDGKVYEAKWYSDNQPPEGHSGQWEVWKLIGHCQ